jgi:hypothetical protein
MSWLSSSLGRRWVLSGACQTRFLIGRLLVWHMARQFDMHSPRAIYQWDTSIVRPISYLIFYRNSPYLLLPEIIPCISRFTEPRVGSQSLHFTPTNLLGRHGEIVKVSPRPRRQTRRAPSSTHGRSSPPRRRREADNAATERDCLAPQTAAVVPRLARPLTGSLDPARHGRRRAAGQLCSRDRGGAAEGELRSGVGPDW